MPWLFSRHDIIIAHAKLIQLLLPSAVTIFFLRQRKLSLRSQLSGFQKIFFLLNTPQRWSTGGHCGSPSDDQPLYSTLFPSTQNQWPAMNHRPIHTSSTRAGALLFFASIIIRSEVRPAISTWFCLQYSRASIHVFSFCTRISSKTSIQ